MTKTAIIATTVVAAGATVAITATWKNYVSQIQERFPDIDKNVAAKAYLKMLTKAFTGGYGDLEHLDDDAMDTIFRAEVFNILNKK